VFCEFIVNACCVLGLTETWRGCVGYDSILTVIDRATENGSPSFDQETCKAVNTAVLLILNEFKYGGLTRRKVSDLE